MTFLFIAAPGSPGPPKDNVGDNWSSFLPAREHWVRKGPSNDVDQIKYKITETTFFKFIATLCSAVLQTLLIKSIKTFDGRKWRRFITDRCTLPSAPSDFTALNADQQNHTDTPHFGINQITVMMQRPSYWYDARSCIWTSQTTTIKCVSSA